VKQYRNLVNRILAATQVDPDIATSPALSEALQDLRRMSSRFANVFSDPVTTTVGRPRIQRTEIVRRIKTLLEVQENQPMSAGEMARAVGVSERMLRDVFQQCFHVSPKRFLRLRQLQQVFGTLRTSEPGGVTVSQVLTQFGVWEFGRFAASYREAFGELPSETLRGRTDC
jgi:AraC family ethanolamine operon transcriptional activator